MKNSELIEKLKALPDDIEIKVNDREIASFTRATQHKALFPEQPYSKIDWKNPIGYISINSSDCDSLTGTFD